MRANISFSVPALLIVGALTLSACGETVSTSSFKGESEKVAQRISDFQNDATSGSQQKICQNDLAAIAKNRLKAAGPGCQGALKDQLTQIDNFGLTIKSISIKTNVATARVKSTWSGKTQQTTLQLVKENGSWKISALQ